MTVERKRKHAYNHIILTVILNLSVDNTWHILSLYIFSHIPIGNFNITIHNDLYMIF